MAVAFKCDICGNLYESYNGFQYDDRGGNHFVKIILSNGSLNRNFDTCPNCMHAVIDFMNSRKEQTDGVQ